MAYNNETSSYVTKSGRLSRRVITNPYDLSTRKQRLPTMNVIPEDPREADRQRELERRRQLEEGERQRAHIAELTQQLNERNNQQNAAQAQIQQLQQQLQALQIQLQQREHNPQPVDPQVVPQVAPPVVPLVDPPVAPQVVPQRDFATEFIAMIGNVQLNHIDVNIPSFSDENSSNPLEFLDEVESYFKMRQIQLDRKLHVVTMLLKNKARIWMDLQDNFQNYDQFKDAFIEKFYTVEVQVRSKNRWLSTRFNPQTHDN